MSYEDDERSISDGRPSFLYTFALGDTVLRYTSGADDISVLGNTWLKGVIAHSSIKAAQRVERMTVTLTFAISDMLGRRLSSAGRGEWSVTIHRFHRSDLADLRAIFKGFLGPGRITGGAREIVAHSYSQKMTRPGARKRLLRTCDKPLYSEECGLDIAAFTIAMTADAPSGRTFTIPGLSALAVVLADSTWFDLGILRWQGDERFIESVSADVITLLDPWEDLAAGIIQGGAPVDIGIAAGCPGIFEICDARFNNRNEFGGYHWGVVRGAFDGKAIV